MWKPAVVAAAALAVAGSSIVYAQQHFAAPDRDGPRFEQRHRLSPEDRAAFVDARIAALKAGLELTPDQANNWPNFEKALREMAQLRAEQIAAREAVEQIPIKRRAHRSIGWRSEPTTCPKEAPRSSGSPTLASHSMTVSATHKRRATRNLRACYGHIIIACTLGTGMMALLIRARGPYDKDLTVCRTAWSQQRGRCSASENGNG